MKERIVISIFCVMMFSCGSLQKSRYLDIETSQETIIYPGISNAPTTHHIVVKAKMKKSGTVFCDTFWTNGYADRARVLNKSMKPLGNSKVKKGEEIYFDFYYFVAPNSGNAAENRGNPYRSRRELAKKNHEGKLLFRFQIGGSKFYYLSINDVLKADPVFGE